MESGLERAVSVVGASGRSLPVQVSRRFREGEAVRLASDDRQDIPPSRPRQEDARGVPRRVAGGLQIGRGESLGSQRKRIGDEIPLRAALNPSRRDQFREATVGGVSQKLRTVLSGEGSSPSWARRGRSSPNPIVSSTEPMVVASDIGRPEHTAHAGDTRPIGGKHGRAGMTADVDFGDDGLVPAVAQDTNSGEVLMMAYVSPAALERTRETGRAHYYSRSRDELWEKGATSGHTQAVREVRIDCDGDALLYLVEQAGGACHTGYHSCFYRTIDDETVGERVFDPDEAYGDGDGDGNG